MCNTAYLELYPASRSTAPAITVVIDGGASILGKTKLSSLLSREEPAESVDFQSVFNPRGDGYQSPGGSSSGSAAAVAAYEWIDIGIGTDSLQPINFRRETLTSDSCSEWKHQKASPMQRVLWFTS
jgi:Asp-tRNA(Asn)/Glu-tRNA(Gln) amidotransferase A subunit family amidase